MLTYGLTELIISEIMALTYIIQTLKIFVISMEQLDIIFVIIDNKDQMIKGSRFIWYNWIKTAKIKNFEFDNRYEIDLSFQGFKTLGKKIVHNRKVIKYKNKLHWIIIDSFENVISHNKQIYWHTDYKLLDSIDLSISDLNKNILPTEIRQGMYSSNYGIKIDSPYFYSESKNGFITTIKLSN